MLPRAHLQQYISLRNDHASLPCLSYLSADTPIDDVEQLTFQSRSDQTSRQAVY